MFNVGGGPEASVSLLELTTLCEEITGNRIQINPNDQNRPGDVPWYITNNSLVERQTGWRPQKAVRDTVLDTFNWIRENEAILAPIFA
jgi:CDP-paratose 2-epimerase